MTVEEKAERLLDEEIQGLVESGEYFDEEKERELYDGMLAWWNQHRVDKPFKTYNALAEYLKSEEDGEFESLDDFLYMMNVYIDVTASDGGSAYDVCYRLVEENPTTDLPTLAEHALKSGQIIGFEKSLFLEEL